MKRYSSLLEQELLQWPDVTARPMFGLRGIYRGKVIFAMLPRTRALKTSISIFYKFSDGAKKREGEKWQRYELEDDRSIDIALARLREAWERAV